MTNSRARGQWGSEQSSTPVTSDAEVTGNSGYLTLGNQVTLGTVGNQVQITAIGLFNGTVASGNIILGACLVDADPPVNVNMTIVAYTAQTAQAGTSAEQKISTVSGLILNGGIKVTGFLIPDGNTGNYAYDTISSANVTKIAAGLTVPPVPFNQIAWTAGTAHYKIKIYYKEFS